MSECYRVGLTYADGDSGPDSVVLKVAATDPVSRQTGLSLGLYEREVRFYTDIAPQINGPVAPCHHAGLDAETGAFHLLLGDAGPAVVGDEIRGATVEQATLALTELGRVHAPLLGDTAMANADWLNRESPLNQALIGQLYAGFSQRYRDQIAAYLDLNGRYNPGLTAAGIPADAVTTSGSGVDPHISEDNARIQARRVAAVRGIPLDRVEQVVKDNTDGRFLGLLGEPGVNVTKLNLALDR